MQKEEPVDNSRGDEFCVFCKTIEDLVWCKYKRSEFVLCRKCREEFNKGK